MEWKEKEKFLNYLRSGLRKNKIPHEGKSIPKDDVDVNLKLSTFEGKRHIDRFIRLIFSYNKIYIGPRKDPITPPLLLEVVHLACTIVFATPATTMGNIDMICSCYTALVSCEHIGDHKCSIFQVTVDIFTRKLCDRFMYKTRLLDLVKDRQIPLAKKEKWLEYQYEVQGRLLKENDSRSIFFIKEMILVYPLFVYQVLEALVKLPCDEAALYEFIDAILYLMRLKKNILMLKKNKEQMQLLQNIIKLAERNVKLPISTRNLIAERCVEIVEGSPQDVISKWRKLLFAL